MKNGNREIHRREILKPAENDRVGGRNSAYRATG